MAGTKRPSSVPQTSPALLAINAHSTAHPAANVFTLRHSRGADFPVLIRNRISATRRLLAHMDCFRIVKRREELKGHEECCSGRGPLSTDRQDLPAIYHS